MTTTRLLLVLAMACSLCGSGALAQCSSDADCPALDSTCNVPNAVCLPEGKILPDDFQTAPNSNRFGTSVAVDGELVFIGATGGSSQGAVYVFERSGRTWTQLQKISPTTPINGGSFGSAVAISGNTLVVGAYTDESAYFFVRSAPGALFTEQAKVTDDIGGFAGAQFGWHVTIDGDTAVIGARQDNENGSASGSAFAFTRSGTTWTRQAKLTASDGGSSDLFGMSVALQGDVALVGAPGANAVYVFERSGTIWTEVTASTTTGPGGSNFGWAMAWDGSVVAVSAIFDQDATFGNLASGGVYVYDVSGTVLTEQDKLAAGSEGISVLRFGYAVAVDAATGRILVGAYRDDDNGTSSGSAFVFEGSGSSWAQSGDKILQPDGTTQDNFGNACALLDDTALIGSWGDDAGNAEAGSVFAFDLCSADSDCANYCGGQTCSASNTCESTNAPAVCTGATPNCDDDSDMCVECLVDSHCADFCDGETCSASNTCESTNTPAVCTGETPFCDEETDMCSAAVTGDPHIEGFLGQHFIVDGAETGDNQVYNMVSSPWMQYNARFSATKFKHKAGGHHVPATQTTEIGLSFAGGKRVRLSLPEESGDPKPMNTVVEVDGERLPTDQRIEPVELAPGVTLSFALRNSHEVRITTPHFVITVDARKHMFPHLDCDVKLVDWTAADELHGLLGQTAHADKAQTAEDEAKGEVLADVFWPWYLDGELKDYHVEGDDVFGTGFVFNRF